MTIIFDLDDTLYLEKLYIYQGFWAVARHIKVSPDGSGKADLYLDLLDFLKKGSTRVFDDLIKKRRLQTAVQELVRIYREAPRHLKLLPDVPRSCRKLRNQGHSLVLLTNGDSRTQWRKIDDLGIRDLFDLILVADDHGSDAWKPSVILMERVRAIYGQDKEQYLFVGNGDDDLEFARRAGIRFIYMKRPRQLKRITALPLDIRIVSCLEEINV